MCIHINLYKSQPLLLKGLLIYMSRMQHTDSTRRQAELWSRVRVRPKSANSGPDLVPVPLAGSLTDHVRPKEIKNGSCDSDWQQSDVFLLPLLACPPAPFRRFTYALRCFPGFISETTGSLIHRFPLLHLVIFLFPFLDLLCPASDAADGTAAIHPTRPRAEANGFVGNVT